jgi:hypothetical protein
MSEIGDYLQREAWQIRLEAECETGHKLLRRCSE